MFRTFIVTVFILQFILMSVFPQFHSFMLRLYIPVSLPVHCYHLQKLMYSEGRHLQNFQFFLSPWPVINTINLLNFDPYVESFSLMSHFANGNIDPTPLRDIQQFLRNMQDWHSRKTCCIECHGNWDHSFYLLLQPNSIT